MIRRAFLLFSLFATFNSNGEEMTVRELFSRGVERFFEGKTKEAVSDWDQEIKLAPARGPHHWQRGLALYYLGDYAKGVAQFESHQKVNGHDVENAAWHFICAVRQKGSSVEIARKKFIPIKGDRRVPMAEIHALYGGKGTAEAVLEAAKKNAEGMELRNQLCYAHLYLGLYYEALEKLEKSKGHMKKAAVDFKMDHYMGKVAQLHFKLRGGK
ncbi:hypothetical protein N9733_09100 [Akkermansiaceae bacterium]|nr:hypothetical protein [Akkermansiaceae bacterium]